MIKRLTFKFFLIALALNFLNISTTNSYFTNQETIANNTLSAGCWALPSAALLDSPSDNHLTNNPAVNFTYESATSTCPTATLTYQFQLATDLLFTSIVTSSSWSSNLFYNFNFITEGKYYWRVLASDNYGHQSISLVRNITYDKTLPTSIINEPWNSNADNDVIFPFIFYWDGKTKGTAADSSSGIDHVELSIHREYLNRYWNGSTWISGSETGTRVLAIGTTSWSYQINPMYITFGKFTIIAHAVDKAGNIENSATIEFENKEIVIEPDFNINLNRSTQKLSFTTVNFPSTDISYEIKYQNSIGEQGIVGVVPAAEIIDGIVSRDFYLGSCTSGGVCTPDTLTVGSTIAVTLGKVTKSYTY